MKSPARPEVWISLGSNLGDREAALCWAKSRLGRLGKLAACSSLYEAEPWGMSEQPLFFNAVCSLFPKTSDPVELLAQLKELETIAGRQPGPRWAPRPLDLDILFWGMQILKTDLLTIPHPMITMRRFVLTPLVEVAPDFPHPQSGLVMRHLLEICADPCRVQRLRAFP